MAHNQIKTYTFADSGIDNGMFILKSMKDIYFSSNGESDSPHRHDYYAIIFIEQGEGIHYVDFKEYKIENNSIYFILPGQMHQVKLSAEPKGWVMTFTEEFLIANSIPDKLINDIYLFNDYGQSPPLSINDTQLPIYQNIVSQIELFSNSLESYTLEAVGSLVKLFLIQSNNHCSLQKINNPQFMLAVTSDYLNKTVKSITGKSAKEHIQSKLITEAKRTLLFSSLSNKELSYELGFDESAHFNNFFKKTTGLTPTEFRISARLS